MTDERIRDVDGYFIESISERKTSDLERIAELVIKDNTEAGSIIIGGLIRKWVLAGCTPDDDEVDAAMEVDGGY
jgi:hypothetical protein